MSYRIQKRAFESPIHTIKPKNNLPRKSTVEADDPKSAKQTILESAKQKILKKFVWKQTIPSKADDFSKILFVSSS